MTLRPLGRLCAALLALALWSTTPSAGAAHAAEVEVAPVNSRSPALLLLPDGEVVVYPLQGGDELVYDTPGPSQLFVEVRRMVVDPAQELEPKVIEARGDGHPILGIKLSAGVQPEAQLSGSVPGTPTHPDRARITVPAGGKQLSLRAPGGDERYIVRVLMDEGIADAVAAVPPATPVPAAPPVEEVPAVAEAAPVEAAPPVEQPATDDAVAAEPPAEEPPAEEPPAEDAVADDAVAEDATAEDAPTDDAPTDDAPTDDAPTDDAPTDDAVAEDAVADDAMAEDDTVAQAVPTDDTAAKEPFVARVRDRIGLTGSSGSGGRAWAAGPELGVGAPMRGDQPVVWAGGRVRYSLVPETVDLGLATGWYRIGLETSLAVVDPFLGAHRLDVTQTTQVVPMLLDARYMLPVELGPAAPFVGGGPALYLAWRSDNGAPSTFGAAVGVEAFCGADIPLGPGSLSPSVSWNGGGRQFGGESSDGAPVRESLSTVRINTTYMFAF